MIEQAYAPIALALQERRFDEAERAATRLVNQEPLNPQGWVFLAEALLLQGFIDAAGKVFERAWLLDPEAEWVGSVKAWLAVLKDNAPCFDMEALLTLPTVTVSAVIITEDEGQALRQCLVSVRQAVDEVVIVDLGSTEVTRTSIADHPQLKLKYLDCRGEQDLALAQTKALQVVTSDWVIFIRENECLFYQDQSAVRQIVSLYNQVYPPVILQVGLELIHSNRSSPITYEADRLFRMRPGLCFWGKVYPLLGDKWGPYAEHVARRAVRLRFGYHRERVLTPEQREEFEQERAEQLLVAAKQNLLKSKELCANYRGMASTAMHTLTWKTDKLLAKIATYRLGDPE